MLLPSSATQTEYIPCGSLVCVTRRRPRSPRICMIPHRHASRASVRVPAHRPLSPRTTRSPHGYGQPTRRTTIGLVRGRVRAPAPPRRRWPTRQASSSSTAVPEAPAAAARSVRTALRRLLDAAWGQRCSRMGVTAGRRRGIRGGWGWRVWSTAVRSSSFSPVTRPLFNPNAPFALLCKMMNLRNFVLLAVAATGGTCISSCMFPRIGY